MNDQTQKTLTELLDEIESRARQATLPPWIYDGRSYAIGNVRHMLRADGIGMHPNDACFIAAARTDVPALVKALRRIDARLSDMRAAAQTENAGQFAALVRGEIDGIKGEVAKLLRERADSVREGYTANQPTGVSSEK